MALIGTLNIGLKVQTKQFTKGLKTAKSAVSGFGTSLFSLKNAIIGLGATIVASKAITALTDSFEKLDGIKKFADLIGASAEELQVLGVAGRKAGMSSIDQLNLALKKMTDNLAEAAGGTGEGAEAFKLLGLNIRELLGLSPTEQFIEIGKALLKIDNATLRASAGMAIFGSRGLTAVELAENMAVNFSKVNTEAEKMNLVFSAVDLKKIEEANDAVTDIGTSLGVMVGKIAVELSPFITVVSKKFVAWAATIDIIDEMAKGIGFVTQAVNILSTTMRTVQSGFEGVAGGLAQIGGAIVEAAAEDTINFINGLKGQSKEWKEGRIQQAKEALSFAQSLRASGEELSGQSAKTFFQMLDDAASGRVGERVIGGIVANAKEIIATADAEAKAVEDARKARQEAGRTPEAVQKTMFDIAMSQMNSNDVMKPFELLWKGLGDVFSDGAKALGGHVDSIIDGLFYHEERKAPTLAEVFDSSMVDIAALSTIGGGPKDPQLVIAEKQLEELKKITKNPVEFIAKMVK